MGVTLQMSKMVNIIESAYPVIVAIIPIAVSLFIYNTDTMLYKIFTTILILLLLYYALLLAYYRRKVTDLHKQLDDVDMNRPKFQGCNLPMKN